MTHKITWTRSGTDVDGDPIRLTGRCGDMTAHVVKSRSTGLWSVHVDHRAGILDQASEEIVVAHAEKVIAARIDKRLDEARKALRLFGEQATSREAELVDALRAALDWIDAVPQDVALPTMPGFDRDWVDGLIQG